MRQPLAQPRARHGPVAVDGALVDLHEHGDLADFEAGEIAQFHHGRHARIEALERGQGTVEIEDGFPVLRVILKYAHGGQSVIREAKRVSTPGLRRYVGSKEIPRVRNGLGMAILSTSKGIMSDRTARASNTGGELLALVW